MIKDVIANLVSDCGGHAGRPVVPQINVVLNRAEELNPELLMDKWIHRNSPVPSTIIKIRQERRYFSWLRSRYASACSEGPPDERSGITNLALPQKWRRHSKPTIFGIQYRMPA